MVEANIYIHPMEYNTIRLAEKILMHIFAQYRHVLKLPKQLEIAEVIDPLTKTTHLR